MLAEIERLVTREVRREVGWLNARLQSFLSTPTCKVSHRWQRSKLSTSVETTVRSGPEPAGSRLSSGRPALLYDQMRYSTQSAKTG